MEHLVFWRYLPFWVCSIATLLLPECNMAGKWKVQPSCKCWRCICFLFPNISYYIKYINMYFEDWLGNRCHSPTHHIPYTKAVLKMIFLFPRWDMLVPWDLFSQRPPPQPQRRRGVRGSYAVWVPIGQVYGGAGERYMGVSKNSGIPKWMVYNGKLLLKWMIWRYPYFWKHPYLNFIDIRGSHE